MTNNIRLDRTGVHDNFCAQCFVSMMCDTFVDNYREQYTQATEKGVTSRSGLEYVAKQRAFVADKLNISIEKLIEFESELALGLPESKINERLSKWGADLRLRDDKWLVLDRASGLEKIDLDQYLEENELETPIIVNGPYGNLVLSGDK